MKLKLLNLIFLIATTLTAQVNLSYYLPETEIYDTDIRTPKEIFGFEVGEWHLAPLQTLNYLKTLDQESERISIIPMGSSYEKRETILMIITSAANQARLELIQKERQRLSDPQTADEVDIEKLPGVVWLGYSIHGNEASGHNAVPLVAYHLAAAQSAEVRELLENTIILIEPFINPDGLNRFSSWVNMHKGKNLVSDSYHREHKEYWPFGRTNHYWFDLNRDWMPAQHPESQGRLKYLYKWLPNIVTDHHEMGTDATFFFQPGVKSRNNPLVPAGTYDLTAKIGKYHVEALDKLGALYFSGEIFDDFYIGKGSTLPDIIGSVGILFEQASVRGHLQESENGDIAFSFAIRNQVTTSLSTLKASVALRRELLSYQRDFFKEAFRMADKDRAAAYILGSIDEKRNYELKNLLRRHQIEVYELKENIKLNGYSYIKNRDFLVPIKQKQYRLIKSMFEERTSFSDSLFYDISTWNLAHSFNLQLAEIKSESQVENLKGNQYIEASFRAGKVNGRGTEYAYLMPWDSYNTTRVLNILLNNNIRCKVAQKPFEISASGEAIKFREGTILISANNQSLSKNELALLVRKLAEENGIIIHAVSTGYSTSGIQLGSFNFAALETVKPLLIVGDGISPYEAGEVWHLLDQRLDIICPMVDIGFFNQLDFSAYNVMIMVNGNYSAIDSAGISHLKDWISFGGTLITTRSANKWLKKAGIAKIEFLEPEKVNKDTVTVRSKYGEAWNIRGAQEIGGSIFETDLDLSHPLGYGFEKNILPVFKRSQLFIKQNANPYNTPALFMENSLLCGYISDSNYRLLQNSAVINVFGLGKGRIIAFTENPNFRAIWYGTNRLFMNALMFGQIIRSPGD